jgi:hypothetical protein
MSYGDYVDAENWSAQGVDVLRPVTFNKRVPFAPEKTKAAEGCTGIGLIHFNLPTRARSSMVRLMWEIRS